MSRRGKDSDHGAVLRANMDRLLAEHGLRVADFLERTGLSSQQYSRTFKTDRGPTMKTLQSWADALGVDMSELTKETP